MSKRNDLPTKARGDAAPAGPVSSKAEMAAFLAEARNAILITGPSGTTDIEGSYVRGAHGPGFLHIIITGTDDIPE